MCVCSVVCDAVYVHVCVCLYVVCGMHGVYGVGVLCGTHGVYVHVHMACV